MSHILEISKKANRAGRVPIKIALLKIHDDAKETNLNGLHWDETYVTNAIESLKMMPICAEFCSEDKEIPIGHGLTGSETNEKGLDEPIFENSEAVGVIEKGSIETVAINGEEIKALCGYGYLFNQRYPKFVKWVRVNHALGNVDTSIEIVGLESNANKIVYLESEPKEDFRTPCEFSFSGTAILSVTPSDSNAIVLEIAQKKEQEEKQMDEKTMRDLIVSTITETNSENSKLNAKIEELNSAIESKDNEIVELNASVEQLQATIDKLEADHKTYGEEKEILEKELAKAKVAEKLAELDSTLGEFNEEEKKCAEEDIDKLKDYINACKNKDELNNVSSEINSIKSKICMNIVETQKKAVTDAKIAEQNSANNTELDIFSEVNSTEDDADNNINIF